MGAHHRAKVDDPSGEGIRLIREYECVVDTGTQVTAIGANQAEELGINLDKLAPVDITIGSIAGEDLKPLGSFFVQITGKTRDRKGREVATSFVIMASSLPFLSLVFPVIWTKK